MGEGGRWEFSAATQLAYDASYDGSVVVGYQSYGYPHGGAFAAQKDGTVRYLGQLPGHSSALAQAVSPDGNTIVGFSSGPNWAVPMRWTEHEGMISLGTLPGDSRAIGKAFDVSADGNTVVGMASSTRGLFEAFRWTPSTGMQPLGDLDGGAFDSVAYDVSDDGQVVVGMGHVGVAGPREAFIWDANSGMRSISSVLASDSGFNLGDFQLSAATGISANGRVIVGYGRERDAADREIVAWRVDLGPVPEPTGAMVLLLTIAPVSYCKRGRRPIHRRNA